MNLRKVVLWGMVAGMIFSSCQNPTEPIEGDEQGLETKVSGSVLRSDNLSPVANALVFDLAGQVRDTSNADGSFRLDYRLTSAYATKSMPWSRTGSATSSPARYRSAMSRCRPRISTIWVPLFIFLPILNAPPASAAIPTQGQSKLVSKPLTRSRCRELPEPPAVRLRTRRPRRVIPAVPDDHRAVRRVEAQARRADGEGGSTRGDQRSRKGLFARIGGGIVFRHWAEAWRNRIVAKRIQHTARDSRQAC